MLEYFQEQMKSSMPLTAEGAAEMVANRVKAHSEADIDFDESTNTEYFNSKIGKHLLFYIKTRYSTVNDITGFDVCKVWEDEIDQLNDLKFIDMNGTTPRFE